MLVYGDAARQAITDTVLEDLHTTMRALAAMQAGVERHAALVAAFIAMGEVAQGIADAEFEAKGVDDHSPAQDASMAVLMVMADAIRRSWDSDFQDQAPLPPDLLDGLSNMSLPEKILLKRPEGYAFYALYPEGYLQAASALERNEGVRVIGIRSIGTGLAALVISALGGRAPITLRPRGDPFRREIKLAHQFAADLLKDGRAHFAVVDEGPGLSGSSFGAVADWLEANGVPPVQIHFFPSHTNDLGPFASAPHRARWQEASRHVVDFDALVLQAQSPMHRLEGWVGDLVGPPDQPIDEISGGAWRARLFDEETDWPPSHLQQERRKFLLRAGGKTWLLKFAGLGREGAEKLELAEALHAAGFAPEPVGYRHGFLVERWVDGARPLSATEGAAAVERIGSYIGFRARNFPATTVHGASVAELLRMARHNTAQGLDEDAACAIDGWSGHIGRLEHNLHRVRTDNRMHAWEWLRLPDGRLFKSDALDHHAAHDLVGCQDATWDIAGAAVELELGRPEREELCRIVERGSQRSVNRDLLAFNEICYAAFQLGHWTLATESLVGFSAEAARTHAAAERYRGQLRELLLRG